SGGLSTRTNPTDFAEKSAETQPTQTRRSGSRLWIGSRRPRSDRAKVAWPASPMSVSASRHLRRSERLVANRDSQRRGAEPSVGLRALRGRTRARSALDEALQLLAARRVTK